MSRPASPDTPLQVLQLAFGPSTDAALAVTAEGAVCWLNQAAQALTGCTETAALGHALEQVLPATHEASQMGLAALVQHAAREKQPVRLLRLQLPAAAGRLSRPLDVTLVPLAKMDGRGDGTLIVCRPGPLPRGLEAVAAPPEQKDPLTGLATRAQLDRILLRVLDDARRHEHAHALLLIDLDQFQLVNEAYGHAVGDELLRAVSRMILQQVRCRDTVARLNGDEFAVVLPYCSMADAQRLGEKICERLRAYRGEQEDCRLYVGASIGLVPIDSRWAHTSALLQAAGMACFAARERGRGRVHAWSDTDALTQTRQIEMRWASRVCQALDDNRFRLYGQRIQPITGCGASEHIEVLVRMLDENDEVVPPGVFLRAAEQFHIASRVDRWVLQQTLSRLRAHDMTAHPVELSINLSGQSLGDAAFHDHALAVLGELPAPLLRRLTVEVTETVAVTHVAEAGSFLRAIRALGVKVALDDFGAGASSFGYLKTLEIDRLKIDGQFIRQLAADRFDQATVRCFVAVARTIGVTTVAEFVDSEPALQTLRELGVDYAQGYLIHRPAPLESLLRQPVAWRENAAATSPAAAPEASAPLCAS